MTLKAGFAKVNADLEFAALDQFEGEDCGSLLSKAVTHRRHAARGYATHILHNHNVQA